MKWLVRTRKSTKPIEPPGGDSGVAAGIKSSPDRSRFRPLSWLVGLLNALLIFALLYYSSYLASRWLPAYEGPDMKSHLTADYKPWPVMLFEPVDPSIIDEIRQERGLPAQLITNGSNWPTSANTPIPPTDETASAPQAASDQPGSGPGTVPPLVSSTPIPASTIRPTQSDATSQPTGPAHPTRTPKPPKKTKTPKPPKPPKNR